MGLTAVFIAFSPTGRGRRLTDDFRHAVEAVAEALLRDDIQIKYMSEDPSADAITSAPKNRMQGDLLVAFDPQDPRGIRQIMEADLFFGIGSPQGAPTKEGQLTALGALAALAFESRGDRTHAVLFTGFGQAVAHDRATLGERKSRIFNTITYADGNAPPEDLRAIVHEAIYNLPL